MTGKKAGLRAAVAVSLLMPLSGCQQAGAPGGAVAVPPTIPTKGGLEMVVVPAGSFEMGNRHGKEDESFVHRVTVDSSLMDKYEVTQAEYENQSLPNHSHC